MQERDEHRRKSAGGIRRSLRKASSRAGISWLRPRAIALAAVLLSAASCAGPAVHPRDGLSPVVGARERELRDSVAVWLGTPYCIGGTGTPCIDCSGFVRRVFLSVFSTDLPRTSEEMRDAGEHVPPGPLAPGDLLVYRISQRRLHVGVYLGHGEFAHASSAKGVMISGIRDRYWRRRFLEARRVI